MRVTATRDQGVTQGVIGRDVTVEPELREVTFVDYNGVPHTVYAHKEGPFETPDDIMAAYYSGELHVNPREDEQGDDDEQGQNEGGN